MSAFGTRAPIRTPSPAATTIADVTSTGYVERVSLHIGTSGWAYKEWKPAFYPATLPQSRFLEHYASVLGACEVNSTAYRLPAGSSIAQWVAATPPSFRFAMKAHRRLVEAETMAWDGAARGFLRHFLESVVPLGERLGPVLFRYLETRTRDDAGLDSVLDALRDGPAFALEFRHESWIDPEVFLRVADAGGTVCVSETAGAVFEILPPGPFAYVRLRADRYSAASRDGWLALLREESGHRPVYAFARHEGLPAGDPLTGVGLAEWLALRQRVGVT
jgi:uncharacterized protein YecE (DUF72 family)